MAEAKGPIAGIRDLFSALEVCHEQGPRNDVSTRKRQCQVFVNEVNGDGGKRKFRSVNVQRSYRDGDDTKYTSSFGLSDLPAAIRVLELAQAHVEGTEAQTE